MIRVVLDTNILISALLTPDGLPAQALAFCFADPELQIVVSAALFAEYEEVIRRPKFKRSEGEITSILRALRESALWVRPSATIRVCLDPDDDLFLSAPRPPMRTTSSPAIRSTFLRCGDRRGS